MKQKNTNYMNYILNGESLDILELAKIGRTTNTTNNAHLHISTNTGCFITDSTGELEFEELTTIIRFTKSITSISIDLPHLDFESYQAILSAIHDNKTQFSSLDIGNAVMDKACCEIFTAIITENPCLTALAFGNIAPRQDDLPSMCARITESNITSLAICINTLRINDYVSLINNNNHIAKRKRQVNLKIFNH